ncbi:MAG TPA: hypothetical protein VGK99_16170 [Acidobacteriota bacterium]|jgi:hypothetical protein
MRKAEAGKQKAEGRKRNAEGGRVEGLKGVKGVKSGRPKAGRSLSDCGILGWLGVLVVSKNEPQRNQAKLCAWVPHGEGPLDHRLYSAFRFLLSASGLLHSAFHIPNSAFGNWTAPLTKQGETSEKKRRLY